MPKKQKRMVRDEPWQYFSPWHTPILREARSLIDEIAHPKCQFKLPLCWREHFILWRNQSFEKTNIFNDSPVVLEDSIAIHWKIILRFLNKKGIAQSDLFSPSSFSNDGPKIPAARIKGLYGNETSDGREILLYGFGAATTYEESLSKAVGELLERSFLSNYRLIDLYRATTFEINRLGKKFLNPGILPGFEDWQIDLNPHLDRKEGDNFYWVKGREIISKQEVFIPAQLIFWSYSTKNVDEPSLGNHTTSGSGGYFTKEGSLLSGIYESIQRDGFLIHWLNKNSPKIVDVASYANKEVQNALAYLKRYNLEPIFLNTRNEIDVPSLTCVMADKNGPEPRIAVGAATGYSLENIILSSLFEALSVNNFQRQHKRHVLPADYLPFREKNISRTERLLLWQGADMLEKFGFFISGRRESLAEFSAGMRIFKNEKEELDWTLGLLKKGNHSVYAYEVHNQVLDKLGYHVSKVVIPKFIPLYLKENLAPLKTERLYAVPKKLGFQVADELNPWPHPFP